MRKRKEKAITRKLRTSYITTIISISLVLFLLGLTGLLIFNAKKLSDYVKENIGFSVILKDNVREVDIIRIQKDLDATPYVKSTEYITRERAAKELQEDLGEDFVGFLGYNPLLASIDVRLYAEYANPDSILNFNRYIEKYSQIKEVFYQKSLIHKVNDNVNKISLIILAFSSLLLIISIVLINNTIRLSVYSKRFLIKTMQLVGATRNFIRKPFLLKSVLNGVLGSFISILLLLGVMYAAQKELKEVISIRDIEVVGLLFVLVIFLGVAITVLSTYFAINKYMRLKEEDLYLK